MQKICTIDDCPTKVLAKGLCVKHYSRKRKHGDPNFVLVDHHGHRRSDSYTPTYISHKSMKARCLNPKHKWFKHYGGRGITICDRWLGIFGFSHFLEDMGERPAGTSIDRKDPNGNYEPDNCRWATPQQQTDNRRPKT